MSPDLPMAIPEHLRSLAIVPRGGEFEDAAWSPSDARVLLDALAGSPVAVESGRVCRREPWGWAVLPESWDCRSRPAEEPLVYAQRSRDEAVRFIETWAEDHGGSVHFALRFA